MIMLFSQIYVHPAPLYTWGLDLWSKGFQFSGLQLNIQKKLLLHLWKFQLHQSTTIVPYKTANAAHMSNNTYFITPAVLSVCSYQI